MELDTVVADFGCLLTWQWKDVLQTNPPALSLPRPAVPSPRTVSLCVPLVPTPPLCAPAPPESWLSMETLDYGQFSQGSGMFRFKRTKWNLKCFAGRGEPQGVSEGGSPTTPALPSFHPDCFVAAPSRIFSASSCGLFYTANPFSPSFP